MTAELDEMWEKLAEICLALDRATEIPRRIRGFTVGTNRMKTFAILSAEEATRGIHVRSIDPLVLADARFEGSRIALSSGRSNWVRLRWTLTPDWTEMRRLVAESHRLASMKNEGIRSKSEFGDLYPILAHALAVATPDDRPPAPHHAGGPMPSLPPAAALRIALWCAESVETLAPTNQHADVARVLALVREAAEAAAHGSSPSDVGSIRARAAAAKLRDASKTTAKDSRALGAARRAAGSASSWWSGKADMVWSGAALAAERAVQAFHETQQAPAMVRSFLVELDDRILLAELYALEPDEAPLRILWRAANDKGAPAVWLALFAGGLYGLRRKVGARYAWVKGARDDVLASVPDGQFERAVSIAFARDTVTTSRPRR